MPERPQLLIEHWLPTKELGIESRRESAPIPGQFPKLKTLHVWWARRPLAASAGAVLASLLPQWTPELATRFDDHPEPSTEKDYQEWFLRLCGILGDPVDAKRRLAIANQRNERLPDGGYGYKQAFKNSPTVHDLRLLHSILEDSWGRTPRMSDPTAGGGSIPYEAIRYGIPAHANELNPVATAVLRAGVEIPARYGTEIVADLQHWGETLCGRIEERLRPYFELQNPNERVVAYIFARTVDCPRTGKTVPLAPNWWLSKSKGGTAIRLVTERDGEELEEPAFEIIEGKAIDKRATSAGTITRGKAVSPWDQLVIDGDYIKAEAQAGRMGSMLYAVATRTEEGRGFRTPTDTDLQALQLAEQELERLLPQWEADDIIPDEEIPDGNKTSEPLRYGIETWRAMFSPRQLLVHGTFVEEYRKLVDEVRDAMPEEDKADVLVALLGFLQNKALNYNSRLAAWHPSRNSMANTFDRHDFSFKWTHGEFEGARALYPWTLSQIVDAYEGIAELLAPAEGGGLGVGQLDHPVPGPVTVTQDNAADLASMPDESVELVCIDPPYYDNVMYAELADFFYVWEKRTLGALWPELFDEELTDKDEEAVANPARFAHAGRRRKELATLDYERKMTGIFSECRRILTDNGVMTVMFTHKKAEAWDTLGQALMEAGFTVEASWPVPTESEQSLHQAKKNSAASTVFLVCRKRPDPDEGASQTFFDSLEGEVREAAREAYARFTDLGLDGVDRLLATYGPALSVVSEHWPVYSSSPDEVTGRSRLLRPDEALQAAQEEVLRLQRGRLVGGHVEFDPVTDYWLLAWDLFSAREFPFDEARKLALSVGGIDVDDLDRTKLVGKKSGTLVLLTPNERVRRGADDELPGVHRDRTSFPQLLDALHTALYVLDLDGVAAAETWLEQRRLTSDERFRSLVEAAVNAVPRVREQGELVVEEAELLERLVRSTFSDIEIPEDDVTLAQGQQSFEV